MATDGVRCVIVMAASQHKEDLKHAQQQQSNMKTDLSKTVLPVNSGALSDSLMGRARDQDTHSTRQYDC